MDPTFHGGRNWEPPGCLPPQWYSTCGVGLDLGRNSGSTRSSLWVVLGKGSELSLPLFSSVPLPRCRCDYSVRDLCQSVHTICAPLVDKTNRTLTLRRVCILKVTILDLSHSPLTVSLGRFVTRLTIPSSDSSRGCLSRTSWGGTGTGFRWDPWCSGIRFVDERSVERQRVMEGLSGVNFSFYLREVVLRRTWGRGFRFRPGNESESRPVRDSPLSPAL